MFGVHKHCDSGDKMVLVCHLISQDQNQNWSKLCDFIGRSPLMSYHPTKFGGHRCRGSGDLARPHHQNVMWLYGQKPLKISHHPPMFGGHGNCGGGDIMALVCRMIKESSDFMGRSPSKQATILPSLMAIGTVVRER